MEHNGKVGELKRLLEPKGYRQIFPDVSDWDVWFMNSRINSPFLD